ncbi:hypothetical protein Cantr_07513 [Candida viswanathii]|uniref:Yippee domain-containing protein n=1 Tax=Candida viswanathii TaxID=5486 RepID=A0A367XYX6_9ASCO|nr:hypothetical protein Cantr_07513 [Candida viswanathii]
MGLKCTNYFENSKYDSPNIQIITCKGCSSHLCLSDLILSDNFNGASGPAYLVDNLINIEFNLNSEETQMKTGLYKINKIKCHQCKNPLGWFYKKSYSYAETYKEGKFVIEKNFINFIENLTTTQLLIERALQNKYRRRYSSSSSSNSTISDLEIDKEDHHCSSSVLGSPFATKEKFKLASRRKSSNSNLLNRLRLPYNDQEKLPDQDNNDDVFVDA